MPALGSAWRAGWSSYRRSLIAESSYHVMMRQLRQFCPIPPPWTHESFICDKCPAARRQASEAPVALCAVWIAHQFVQFRAIPGMPLTKRCALLFPRAANREHCRNPSRSTTKPTANVPRWRQINSTDPPPSCFETEDRCLGDRFCRFDHGL